MAKKDKVEISIISERGDDKVVLPVAQALTRVRTEVTDKGRWLYLDGQFTSVDSVTEQDLSNAQDIVLGDTLLGGQQ
jgi:hypothetical protein